MKNDSDKEFYDNIRSVDPEKHGKFMKEISFYFNVYKDRLNHDLQHASGKVLELGAGSCGVSLNLTKLTNCSKVVAADISVTRMDMMISTSAKYIEGDIHKIEKREVNFNNELPFDDESFSAVFFDASLHHSRSIWKTLMECNRVLEKEGLLIAQRESFLSLFRATTQLKKLLETPEVAAEVSENMYLKQQYEYYLTVTGFSPEFLKASPNKIKNALSSFNGTLFCDGIWYCKKVNG